MQRRHYAGEIRFCLETKVDTLDLRHADRAMLQAFAALIKKVVDYRTTMGASNVAEHNDVLVYMSKLMELNQLVQATLDTCS